MKMEEVFKHTFKAMRKQLDEQRAEGRRLWQQRLGTASEFCRAVVSNGYLSETQMQRAAQRYRLGASRDGGVIFWQIDECDQLRDGKIMHYRPDCHRDHDRKPTWTAYLLRKHGQLPKDWNNDHCLFGLHLIYDTTNYTNFTKFSLDDIPAPQNDLSEEKRTEIAQYENALFYNDFVVSSLMGKFQDKEALVIYLPDHGETIYDNGSNFAGHVEENPNRQQLEVPLVFWASPAYRQNHPEKWQAICAAVNRPYMTDDMIHTLLDILDIRTSEFNPAKSVINPAFASDRKRMVRGRDYDADMKTK